eukprot:7454823-Alexandrium_andersonii.AAC.1
MPSKSEITANGLSSSWDWLWLSGAISRWPPAEPREVCVADGVSGIVLPVEPPTCVLPPAES